jgi:hypothetical protein
MPKKKSSSSTLDDLLNNCVSAKWSSVDTENKFVYEDMKYIIDKSIKQYKVLSKAGDAADWTNEALMTRILVVDDGEEIHYFDENMSGIKSDLIHFC